MKRSLAAVAFLFLWQSLAPSAAGQTDSTRAGASFHALPYVYYTPETDWAFGGMAVLTFRTDSGAGRFPSSILLDAYITVKRQYKFTLAPGVYFDENRLFVSCAIEYGRIVDRFWGIGPRVEDSDSTEYVKRLVRFQFRGQVVLTGALKGGVLYEYERTTILESGLNPLL